MKEKVTINLRPWKEEDLPTLVELANNPKIARFMTDQFPHPYTRLNAKSFIDFAGSHLPLHIFAIEQSGKCIGSIGIHPQQDIMRRNAELGYWLGEPYWGRGITTQAIRQMVQYGFANFDIDRIFARPFGTNIASQKVLEKAGFVLEGRFEKTIIKNGELLDELIYSVRRQANSNGKSGHQANEQK
jgi:[ribosomal protein S5]-alanine N-acetyltransferase